MELIITGGLYLLFGSTLIYHAHTLEPGPRPPYRWRRERPQLLIVGGVLVIVGLVSGLAGLVELTSV